MQRLITTLFAALLVAPAIPAQDPPAEPIVEDEIQLTEASPIKVETLLEELDEADDSGDAYAVAEVLTRMAAHTNPEFLDAGLDALKYKASKEDKKAAKKDAAELGMRGKVQIDKLVQERISEVQAAGAQVLAAVPGKKNAATLHKALKAKGMENRTAAQASIVDALGRLDFHKAEDDVRALLETWRDPHVSKACIRFFGQIRTTSYANAELLCNQLVGPQPEWVDDPNNPPAAYWEARWKLWQGFRRDVTWSLKKITGQTFYADEGEKVGDKDKALEYIEANKKDLGLK